MTNDLRPTVALHKTLGEMNRVSSEFLALPFDMVREQYAKAVRSGLVERSLIASARFERGVSTLELLTLGCLARRY